MDRPLPRKAAMLSVCLKRRLFGLALALCLAGPAAAAPQIFDTPEAAAQALLDALARDDRASILMVLGDEFEDQLFTDEASRERESFREVVASAKKVLQLREDDADTRVMVIGERAWPLPIPIVRTGSGWAFDTAAGVDEIITRQIGANELATIDALRAYVDAQVEYASEDRDGDEVLEYARKVISTPGKKDGLYWETATASNDPASPLGPYVAELPVNFQDREKTEPFNGYYYRILTRQGESVPGGRYDYIINGNMIAGFAMLAVPAEYAETGVMTFVISHQGKLYQKDLGDETTLIAAGIQEYSPDTSWDLVTRE